MDTMTLAELFERYGDLRNLDAKTMQLYAMLLDRLRAFLGHEPTVADLDDLVISRYLRERATHVHRGKTIRPASVQKDKVMLQAVWNLAARKRWAKDFPELPRIKVAKSIPTGRAYTAEDVSRIIRRARHRRGSTGGRPSAWWWPTLIYMAYCTGERATALLSLRWQEIDLQRRRVRFLGETGRGRRTTSSGTLPPTWLRCWPCTEASQRILSGRGTDAVGHCGQALNCYAGWRTCGIGAFMGSAVLGRRTPPWLAVQLLPRKCSITATPRCRNATSIPRFARPSRAAWIACRR